ncbi:Ammonium transporter 2 member 3, partial [Linum perenne]
GFNGAPYAANIDASITILNTNISVWTTLLVWTSLDVVFFGKLSVIRVVQGMMTRLICITPAAGKCSFLLCLVLFLLSKLV